MGRAIERSGQLPELGADRSDQDVGEAAAFVLGGAGCGNLGGEGLLMQPFDDASEQLFLGLEMMVERLPRQAGGLCRLLDRGASEAVPAKYQHRGVENAGAGAHLTILTKREEMSNDGIARRDEKSRQATTASSMLPIGRHFICPTAVRPACIAAFDIRPVIASHRGRVQKRIERVLRQIAILVVGRVALDQHMAAFGIVADPADDAAPGDVLTVERLEIDRSAILHVNDLGFLPWRGEEQSEDESKAGHGVLHRARAGNLRLQRGGSKRLRPSAYTNLIPITSPFLQATLQALPGDVRSNFS